MTKDELKRRICDAIDKRGEEIIALGEDIFAHPELGYKEFRTSAKVEEKFKALGLKYESGIAITGLKARLKGKARGATLCVMGELDSVLCPGHPHADPLTGAAHSCGHNAQAAAMVGVGMGLVDTGAMQYLGGDIVLVAVPAEEYVEIEYRSKLRKEGKIQFLGGKQQFIVEGGLDDVDLAMMVHAITMDSHKMTVGGTNNGFVGKFIRYKGKEAHAGGAPHAGVNALNAAMLGLMGIHAQRETLKDDDTIRIHPIITKGGDLVNIIPADVRMETYVRGKRMPAIIDAAKKVDRALKAGAMAVGAEVEIETLPLHEVGDHAEVASRAELAADDPRGAGMRPAHQRPQSSATLANRSFAVVGRQPDDIERHHPARLDVFRQVGGPALFGCQDGQHAAGGTGQVLVVVRAGVQTRVQGQVQQAGRAQAAGTGDGRPRAALRAAVRLRHG